MEKVLKICKINILSLIALPILLIATASKLAAKALERVTAICSVVLLSILLTLGFKVFKSPDNTLQAVLYTIAFLAIFAGIVALFLFLANVATEVITSLWSKTIHIFESIYEWTYERFLRLKAVCDRDYQYINLNSNPTTSALLCLIYTILKFINKFIITVISFALPASLVLSAVFVISRVVSAHIKVKSTFGIGLFAFLGKFDTFSLLYGVLMYLAYIALYVIIFLSLGMQWNEWAQELHLTGTELSEDVADLRKNDIELQKDAKNRWEKYESHMHTLKEHMKGLDALGNKVESLLSTTDNALLRSNWGNYFGNLSDIVDECSKYRQGIPVGKFKRLVPRIKQLERQRKDVLQLIEKLQEQSQNPFSSSLFFAGCNTLEKLEKRYKSLCKAYHPDAAEGDTETFQNMQQEYLELRKILSANAG